MCFANERKVPIGSITERQLEALLKALAAKAGLENDEIVGAYARRRTKIANERRTSALFSKNGAPIWLILLQMMLKPVVLITKFNQNLIKSRVSRCRHRVP